MKCSPPQIVRIVSSTQQVLRTCHYNLYPSLEKKYNEIRRVNAMELHNDTGISLHSPDVKYIFMVCFD